MESRFSRTLLDAAHSHCIRNLREIEDSALCGCFHCETTFPPGAVEDWYDEDKEETTRERRAAATALCPRCGIDAVIGDASGFAIADPRFLNALKEHWFGFG